MTDSFQPTPTNGPPAQEAPPAGFDPGAATTGTEEVDVDFSGASDDFQPLESGWYLFTIESATAREDNGGPLLSKAGAPMIKWVARVVEGPRQNSPMFNYTVTKGPGAFSLRRFINQAFGQKLSKEPQKLKLGLFIGMKYWAQVGPQKDNAEFVEYKGFRPVNDPPPNVAGEAPAGIASRI